MSDKRTYAEMMSELQHILADIQSNDLDVDVALAKYEQGQALIAELEIYLATAENKITHRKPSTAEDIISST